VPGWTLWLLFALFSWTLFSVLVVFVLARGFRVAHIADWHELEWPEPESRSSSVAALGERRRILVVDDDPSIRLLLRTTLADDEFTVEEAVSAEEAGDLARFWRPDVVVLDIGLPGIDGLTFSRALKRDDAYGRPHVILLTGEDTSAEEAEAAGADAILRKPFSPLELIGQIDRISGPGFSLMPEPEGGDAEQLLIYARDLSHLLAVERGQRRLLQQGYRQTATALADALEAKDPVSGLHALRVQRFALDLTAELDERLLDDPSLEYGFLLHDVGKLGVPDTILQKGGPLSESERRMMQRHPLIGVEILADVAPLQGEGLKVVRFHHERWDGTGYPDRLAGERIPIGARIFSLVDSLDAMTSERPYRDAIDWEDAVDEIVANSGSQFDPTVVAAFERRELRLRRISEDLAERAA
jgi:response regulator RpfG family c-di-GMP phosphodiesterase